MFGFFLCTEKSLKMPMHQLCVFYWSEIKYYINKIRYIKHVVLLLLCARTLLCNTWMNPKLQNHFFSLLTTANVWSIKVIIQSHPDEQNTTQTNSSWKHGESNMFKFEFWWIIMEVCNVFWVFFQILIIQASYYTPHIDVATWLCHLL